MTKDMELTGNWNYPTAIRFGAGRISELPDACRVLGMERPLMVTDPGLAGLPMIEKAVADCRAAVGSGVALTRRPGDLLIRSFSFKILQDLIS